jgi:hypothetical protein
MTERRATSRTAVVAVSALMLGACGTQENHAPSETAAPPVEAPATAATWSHASLLTRVQTPTGSVAEFWQVKPGDVFFTEAGGRGTHPAVTARSGIPLSTLWTTVAPGKQMPDGLALADATIRQASGDPTGAGTDDDVPSSAVSEGVPAPLPGAETGAFASSQALTPRPADAPPGDPNDFCGPTWFYNHLAANYCGAQPGFSYYWCLYDRWLPSVAADGLAFDRGAVCNRQSSNDVLFTVSRSDSGSGIWSLPSQSWRTWSHVAASPCGLFSCNWEPYSVHIGFSGSWGDLQFAGVTCYPNSSCAS